MSPFMKTVILWGGIILLLSYMFRINPVNVIQGVVHAVQTVHNTQGK